MYETGEETKKILWAVFVKEKNEWKQYTNWEKLDFAKLQFENAKTNGYQELEMRKQETITSISLSYKERNGHTYDCSPFDTLDEIM